MATLLPDEDEFSANTSVNAGLLPRDVLVKIFSYCSVYDLVESIQYVCSWWQEVSWEKCLWQRIEYEPLTVTKERMINVFRTSPLLRAVNLARLSIVDTEIYKELVVNCLYLEVLSISWDVVYDAVTDCSVSEPLTSIKTLKLRSRENQLINFDCIRSFFPNVEHLEFNLVFRKLDFVEYLKEKQDLLHTLSLRCRTEDDSCVLPYLSVCENLKTLSLMDLCENVGESFLTGPLCLNTISILTVLHSEFGVVSDSVNYLNLFSNVHLQLSICYQTSGDFFQELGLRCQSLSKLMLCFERQGTLLRDHNLKQLSYFKRLRHLCICYNDYITDDGVVHLKDIPNLTHLQLFGCARVTPLCLKVICGFSKLVVLKFDMRNTTADVNADDVKNKDLQLMFYNCPREMLERLRKQHLRVCFLGDGC